MIAIMIAQIVALYGYLAGVIMGQTAGALALLTISGVI